MNRFFLVVAITLISGCSKPIDHTKYFDKLSISNWKISSDLKKIEPPEEWKTVPLDLEKLEL